MNVKYGRVLGLVPARAGSKGIAGKNLRVLAGRPLLDYTAGAARESGVIERLVLSTDSPDIADVGRQVGLEVPFLRPPELASDEAPMFPVVEHALSTLEHEGWIPDIVVLLQPTAPLRQPEDIRLAVEILVETGCDSVVSVIEIPRHFTPHYVMKIVDGRLIPFLPEGKSITRRQDAPPAYSRDGAVYAMRRAVVVEGRSLYGDDSRPLVVPSSRSIALDTVEDWEAAEGMLSIAPSQ